MRTLGIIPLGLALVIGGAVAWCKVNYPTYAYRYRMTVDVTVDGVAQSGSGVIGVQLSRQPRILPDVLKVVSHTLGEAVFVDLGKGRNVIALLASGPNGNNLNSPDEIVPRLFNINTLDDGDLPKILTLRGRREIPEQYLPTFVTFADLNDPKSARVIRPDQFAQVFGPGVRFKDAWIEMTSEPVTRGIETRLPWWNRSGRPAVDAYRAWLKGQTAGPAIEPETLFKRG